MTPWKKNSPPYIRKEELGKPLIVKNDILPTKYNLKATS